MLQTYFLCGVGVAWPIIGRLGRLDPGSNPGHHAFNNSLTTFNSKKEVGFS